MKKSNAIYKLEGKLIELDKSMSTLQYPDRAAAIIEFVEDELGMLPPNRFLKKLKFNFDECFKWEVDE